MNMFTQMMGTVFNNDGNKTIIHIFKYSTRWPRIQIYI